MAAGCLLVGNATAWPTDASVELTTTVQPVGPTRSGGGWAGLHALRARQAQQRHPGHLDSQTEAWGVKVANVELKHIDLGENMVRVMARQAEAERERRQGHQRRRRGAGRAQAARGRAGAGAAARGVAVALPEHAGHHRPAEQPDDRCSRSPRNLAHCCETSQIGRARDARCHRQRPPYVVAAGPSQAAVLRGLTAPGCDAGDPVALDRGAHRHAAAQASNWRRAR